MNFSQFKQQLSADLWESFTENFYIYESDAPQNIANVKKQINSLLESIQAVDDGISEEEEEKLIDELIPFIYKSQLDNLGQEDLEYFGELIWYNLYTWAIRDRFWYDREKGGIYDDNDEDGLYSK